MAAPSVDVEAAILAVLLQANRPIKARAIAVLLSAGRMAALHKRDINPTLYRMRSRGRLSLDVEFRWSLCQQNPAGTVPLQQTQSPRSAIHSDSSTEIGLIPPLADGTSTPVIFQENRIGELPQTTVTNAEGTSESITEPSQKIRVIGNLRIRQEMSQNERHCTECSQAIPKREIALVVDGAPGGLKKFCSDDCFQTWESLYWQRLAISHLGLTREELKHEQRDLRIQRRFSRFK
jgi:hypothetical protein